MAITSDITSDIALGRILRIPCKFIKGKSDAQPLIIKAIAQELTNTSKNVLPVIIRQIDEDEYEGILNLQVLDAARQAKLDFVWCIVVDEQMAAQLEVETGQIVRVNITTASEKEIAEVLLYFKAKSKSNRIDPEKAAKGIVEHRKTKKLTNLNFLTNLRCGIGKATIKPLSESLIVDS